MTPFTAAADAVLVAVRVTPKASRAALGPVAMDADGRAIVRARVTAAPEDGKANDALCRMAAKEWHVPQSRVSVVQGATARRKMLRIEGSPTDLLPALTAWAETHHG